MLRNHLLAFSAVDFIVLRSMMSRLLLFEFMEGIMG